MAIFRHEPHRQCWITADKHAKTIKQLTRPHQQRHHPWLTRILDPTGLSIIYHKYMHRSWSGRAVPPCRVMTLYRVQWARYSSGNSLVGSHSKDALRETGQVRLRVWTVAQCGSKALELWIERRFEFPATKPTWCYRIQKWDSHLNTMRIGAEMRDTYRIDSDMTTFSDASFSCWSLSCDLLVLDLDFPAFDVFSELATSMDGIKSWMEVAYWRHKAFSFSTFCTSKRWDNKDWFIQSSWMLYELRKGYRPKVTVLSPFLLVLRKNRRTYHKELRRQQQAFF